MIYEWGLVPEIATIAACVQFDYYLHRTMCLLEVSVSGSVFRPSP